MRNLYSKPLTVYNSIISSYLQLDFIVSPADSVQISYARFKIQRRRRIMISRMVIGKKTTIVKVPNQNAIFSEKLASIGCDE